MQVSQHDASGSNLNSFIDYNLAGLVWSSFVLCGSTL